jgi:hypothetical protein
MVDARGNNRFEAQFYARNLRRYCLSAAQMRWEAGRLGWGDYGSHYLAVALTLAEPDRRDGRKPVGY